MYELIVNENGRMATTMGASSICRIFSKSKKIDNYVWKQEQNFKNLENLWINIISSLLSKYLK